MTRSTSPTTRSIITPSTQEEARSRSKDVAVTRPAPVLVMISSRRGCASRGRGVAGPTGALPTAVARRGDYLC
jgi:hypothetical protein